MKTFSIRHFKNKSDWSAWKQARIDAADAAIITGENPWETKEELLARKSGKLGDPKPETSAMIRGRTLRPIALAAYQASLAGSAGLKPRMANLESEARPWQIALVDAFQASPYHLAEIRCGEAAYAKAKAGGRLPKPYWAEAQHTLAVTGSKKINFYFYSDQADEQAIVIPAYRSEGFITDLIEAEISFYKEMQAAKAEEARKTELRGLVETIQLAIKGEAPRVDKTTYRTIVPVYLNRAGTLTPAGAELLAA